MSLEKERKIDSIEVVGIGYVQYRTVEIVTEDGKEISRRYVDRQVLEPGADLTDIDSRVAAIATAAWTPEVLQTLADIKAAEGP